MKTRRIRKYKLQPTKETGIFQKGSIRTIHTVPDMGNANGYLWIGDERCCFGTIEGNSLYNLYAEIGKMLGRNK